MRVNELFVTTECLSGIEQFERNASLQRVQGWSRMNTIASEPGEVEGPR